MSKISYTKYGKSLEFTDLNGTFFIKSLEREHEIWDATIELLSLVDSKLDKLLEIPK